ncbi:uncharacterized protein LOC121005608 [Bufo bufo]|uniref:uncharacterized protein LOC121005608 n=1 Tax=Bufo bufo TaxID=8384 RepID=UPI001ABEC6C4|nr:uncharacterized protein LOC121005608 [Bufo bufo]
MFYVFTVKKTKTRWNSCRDQFRRELTEMGRSDDGAPRKRPYMYTKQLRFLKPVMDLRPTVDSHEEPDIDESQQSNGEGAETPAVFFPETSPTHQPTEEHEQQPGEPARPAEVFTEETQRRQTRHRRAAPQASSGLVTKEIIDSQVIQYLAQKRTEVREETMMRGLAPLLQRVPVDNQATCMASLILVLEMYGHPYQGDIHTLIERVRHQVVLSQNPQPTTFPPRPPTGQGPSCPPPNVYLSQSHNQPLPQPNYHAPYPTGAQDPGQARPGPSYAGGSFTRDLFDI